MKTITIGRGEGCNINIDDEMMSRRHAIIKIPTFGGMEIVDMSKNGTSVNGIRLRPNVPFPVSRKDVVTFAEVAQLDWSKVPDPLKYYKIGAIVVGGLIVLLLAVFLLKGLFAGSQETQALPATEQVQKPVEPVTPEQPAQPEEETQAETPAEGETVTPPSSESQESAKDKDDEIIDFRGTARQNREKREAAERARQQKAKEQQKQKEQQRKEQQQKEQQQKEQQKQEDSKPADGNSSKKEYKPEMI